MPRSGTSRSDDEEDEEELEEDREAEDDEEDDRPSRRSTKARPRPRKTPRRPPVRRWRSPDEEPVEEEDETEGHAPPPRKPPVYWRARDSLFFEPLVALAIVVVLLVGLYAYTQNWPPMYVVESDSMQHGPNDQLGLLNAGDIVLAQKVSFGQITPYVVGLATGYSTYGEYGDVLLYEPNGGAGSTPVIHRAIVYLDWNPDGSYNATGLAGLACGTERGAVFAYFPPGPMVAGTCQTTDLTGTLDFYNIGWNSVDLSIPLSAPALGKHSGFVTLGDNNDGVFDQSGAATPIISALVEPGWIVGVARGMLPWFGAVKLLFEGLGSNVPSQSWEFMGLTIIGVILVAFGIHYALRREGIESPIRREEEEEAREEAGAEEEVPRRHWWPRLTRDTDDSDEDEKPPRHRPKKTRPSPTESPSHRGRPAPRVRRAAKPGKSKPGSDDDEL